MSDDKETYVNAIKGYMQQQADLDEKIKLALDVFLDETGESVFSIADVEYQVRRRNGSPFLVKLNRTRNRKNTDPMSVKQISQMVDPTGASGSVVDVLGAQERPATTASVEDKESVPPVLVMD